jgi:hypothetical protein
MEDTHKLKDGNDTSSTYFMVLKQILEKHATLAEIITEEYKITTWWPYEYGL